MIFELLLSMYQLYDIVLKDVVIVQFDVFPH